MKKPGSRLLMVTLCLTVWRRACCERRALTIRGGDVPGDRGDLDAGRLADFLRGRLESVTAASGDDKADAFARERERAGASQAFGCRANQCRFAANAKIHSQLLL